VDRLKEGIEEEDPATTQETIGEVDKENIPTQTNEDPFATKEPIGENKNLVAT
jgi:hypothetical protein